MNKKISQLTELTQLDRNDEFPLRRGEENFKIKAGNLNISAQSSVDYKTTSNTSVTVTTALVGTDVTFTLPGNPDALAYSIGVRTRATDSGRTGNFIEGIVRAYSGNSLTIAVDTVFGQGTTSAWVLNIGGAMGAAGSIYKTTSATSVTLATALIGTDVSFTVEGAPDALAYTAGVRTRATSTINTAAPVIFLEGVVKTYAGNTLTITIDTVSGQGTFAGWVLNIGAGSVATPAVTPYKTTSATSVTLATALIGTDVSFTVGGAPDALAYTAGVRTRATSAAAPAVFLEGVVKTYSGNTLTITVDTVSGQGAVSGWLLNIGAGSVAAPAVTSPQFWVAFNGNDTTGDGSSAKPFATLSKVKSFIQATVANVNPSQTVTVIVVGGTYANDVNMVIEGAGGVFFTYTIFCHPGVTINQTKTSFYNNQTVNGALHIQGDPDLRAADNLGGVHLLDVKARRNGAAQVIYYLSFRDISCNVVADTKPVRFLSAGNGAAGPSVINFKAANITANISSYTVMIDGQDNIITFRCTNVANAGEGAIGIQLGGSGQPGVTGCAMHAHIASSRLGNVNPGQAMTGIKIATRPAIDANWGAGSDIIAGLLIRDTYFFYRASASNAIDITNLGDLTNTIFLKDCIMFKSGAATGFSLVGNVNGTDRITVINCITQLVGGTQNNPVRGAVPSTYGNMPGFNWDNNRGFFLFQNYDF